MIRVVSPRTARLRVSGLAVVLLPCLALSALAQGAPRSVAECERLKNDLAYNQCLAMFGPPAKNVASGDGATGGGTAAPVPPSTSVAGIPSVEEPELATSGRRGRRGRHARRGGRQSAVFAVASAEGADAAPTRRSRRRRHR